MYRAALLTVCTAVLVVLIIVCTPAGELLADRLTHVDPLTDKADYIIVCGGDRSRAVQAAQLYKRRWAPKVVVTGLGASSHLLAAICMDYGVPRGDILIDENSPRTRMHPKTVLPHLGQAGRSARIIVVTSSMHTSRTRACFLAEGYTHVTMRTCDWQYGGEYSSGDLKLLGRAKYLTEMLYETMAWSYYKTRGWL